MELSLPNLDFTISINACHDEIMHKMQVLTNMEIQLLRKFQHQVNNSDMHYKMVHDVRVLIINLEEVYKDVKEYFDEMGIKFVYDFFRKIQVLMVCGYNFLSQALLVNVDKIQDKKTKDSKKPNTLECNVCKCTCSDGSKNKKRQIKEVEQYDYKISMLQNEQQKITSQIQAIYEKIMIQKPMIEKTKPSLAIRELEDMKEHLENVMESTNSIFQETYMMKYVEFKNYLTQIKKPQDIVEYFITNMNFNMKEKFLKAMQKAIYKAQNMQQRLQRMHLKDVEVQTEKIKQVNERQSGYRGFSSLKPQKNSTLLTKQRKYNEKIIAEVQYMRKQINTLMSQNNQFKKQVQKKQEERLKFQQNFQTLEQLYNKRSYELEVTQSENKWLANEKQAQSKKLRLEIKELKKQQVEMVNQQTQIFIAPDYVSASTETQIVHFQNQVQNEIINVLKKSNEKMIQNLNEKQRKIRQLVSIREQYILLKECKVLCLGFLDDLREVTTYKMNEIAKEQQRIIEKKKVRQPIIPLNQNTSNNSVIITINKLTQEIKTLLLGYDLIKKRTNEKRQSNASKNLSTSQNSRKTSRKSSKLSQFSDRSTQLFFRNTQTRKSSMIPIKKQSEFVRSNKEPKKSMYLEQYLQKAEKMSSNSVSGADIAQKDISNMNNQVKNTQELFAQKQRQVVDSLAQGIQQTAQRKSNQSFQGKMTIFINQQQIQQFKSNNIIKDVCIQTDLLKINMNDLGSQECQYFLNKNEMSQQTDILSEQLTQFQKLFNLQSQELAKLKALIEQDNKNCINKQNTSRKNPYLRKPVGKLAFDRIRSPESERNFVSVNNSLPMNNTEISQSIKQHMNKDSIDQSVFAKTSPVEHSSSVANIYKPTSMTLESRLQQLINPKNNQSTSTSNLIVFKKSQQEYRKKTTQIATFEDIKVLDKNLKQKQKLFRSTCRQQSLLISTQTENRWKQIVNKLDQSVCSQKENIKAKTKTKNQSFVKSKFVERIIEQNSKNQSTHSNESTLIEVSKKSPQQRQQRVSPNFELTENVFLRTLRQMLLTSQSKQKLVKKIEEICQEMEKQKQLRKARKTIKTSFTTRDLRSDKAKKQMTQIFKLGQAVQY